MTDPRGPFGAPSSGVTAREVWTGIAIAAALHVAIIGTLLLIWPDYGIPFFLMGAIQLVYLLPAYFVARVRGRRGIAVGIVIAFGLTLLLAGACFGVVMFGSR